MNKPDSKGLSLLVHACLNCCAQGPDALLFQDLVVVCFEMELIVVSIGFSFPD